MKVMIRKNMVRNRRARTVQRLYGDTWEDSQWPDGGGDGDGENGQQGHQDSDNLPAQEEEGVNESSRPDLDGVWNEPWVELARHRRGKRVDSELTLLHLVPRSAWIPKETPSYENGGERIGSLGEMWLSSQAIDFSRRAGPDECPIINHQ